MFGRTQVTENSCTASQKCPPSFAASAADVHEPPSYANDARGATAGWSADTAYDAPPTITAVITKVPHDARHSPPAALITVMRC